MWWSYLRKYTMKRVQFEKFKTESATEKRCNMESVEHEKVQHDNSVTRNNCRMKIMQMWKKCNMEVLQYRKSEKQKEFNTKNMQHEKSATRRKCQVKRLQCKKKQHGNSAI